MNNRNQTQTNRSPAPAATLTYLNVFTVDTHVNDGKRRLTSQRRQNAL